ncbi:MAG: hypothetical protein IT360_01415 [Gemmatimonadaceae bacterium]|nr:hypothetical protein [Gemmatimonadaceae bacterium]
MVAALATPQLAGAQACEQHRAESSLGHLHGLIVDSISVGTALPSSTSIVGAVARRLHARSSPGTIRRLIAQERGVPIDTLRLAESMRLLRRTRLLSDASLDVRECHDSGRATLDFRTTDAWTARGGVRIAGSRASASLGEDNLFGSGRSLRTSLRVDEGQPGFGVQYVDPWLLGAPVALTASRNLYRGGSELGVGLSTVLRSALDPWRAEMLWRRTVRQSLASSGDRVERAAWRGAMERRVRVGPDAVTWLLVGAERIQATLSSDSTANLVGPSRVTRDFTGVTLGIARRSLSYAQRNGMLGTSATVDVPVSLESDIALTIGHDAHTGAPTQHLDAWVGRVWPAGARSMVAADGWLSGFKDRQGWSAGTARASLFAVIPTARGEWNARLSTETLLDPDPDIRSLASFDPTVRLFPSRGLAETATIVTVERDETVRQVSRGYLLRGAIFAAASRRWDLASGSVSDRGRVALLGLGLRLRPTRVGRATVRLDVGWPVAGRVASRRPAFSLSVMPWFEHDRRRSGRSPQ